MKKKSSILLIGVVALMAWSALILIAPSWSSPTDLFVTTSAPKNLSPTEGTKITLSGGGFSPATSLWLVPERSLRTAITATLATYGSPNHFILRDDRLYVANGPGGFFIVQGLQSPVPSISGALNCNGQGMEIVLRQNEALMAGGNGGLQIIDIRDAANPQLLAELKSVAPALSVATVGKIAYVAAGREGLQLVDLSNPRTPRRLGQLTNLAEAYKVSSDEGLLIVDTGATGGWIYDISIPEAPRRLAKLPVGGGSNTVMIRHGNILYWATKILLENRLYSFDLSQPNNPRLLTVVPLINTPMGISCNDDQIAVALGSSGTQLFSLTDSNRVTIAARARTRFSLVLGRDLWSGDGIGELLRLDQQGGAALTNSPILPDFSPLILPIVTPHLFLLGDKSGLAIYDRGEENTPVLLARLELAGLTQQYLAADQRHLWLATRNDASQATGTLISVDISIPSAPRITAEMPLPRYPIIAGESGTTLVITTGALYQPPANSVPALNYNYADALHFIDTSRPESPALFLTYPLTTINTGIRIADNWLVLMEKGGLFRVIDLSDKDTPKEVGSLQMPWLQTAEWSGLVNIVIKDKVAFISSSLGKIVAIDLQDPRHPKNLGIFTLDGPVNSLLCADRYLLADINKKGLVIIDVTNPRTPKLHGTIPLPGSTHRGSEQGGTFWYFINDAKGLCSLPLPRRLQSSVVGTDRLIANLEQSLPPGAYCFWLTDEQNHILLPGISWVSAE